MSFDVFLWAAFDQVACGDAEVLGQGAQCVGVDVGLLAGSDLPEVLGVILTPRSARDATTFSLESGFLPSACMVANSLFSFAARSGSPTSPAFGASPMAQNSSFRGLFSSKLTLQYRAVSQLEVVRTLIQSLLETDTPQFRLTHHDETDIS